VIWEELERRFAQQAEGEVKLFVNEIITNNVFAEVSLPTLKANPNIQLKIMKDAGNIDCGGRVFSNEKVYYKLNLGGVAPQHFYGYTSILILNKDNQVEVIRLETD